jgi:hypothetical protein
MEEDQDYGFFQLKVDFKKDSGDPSRVFKSMTGLIESVQTLDKHLSVSISPTIQTELILQDIQAGSLIAKLKNVVVKLPDEALKQGEIKQVIGHFLVGAKHKFIDWCSDKDKISNRNEVKQLEGEIKVLAEKTDIKYLPAYTPPNTETLLFDINSIRDALSNLEEEDFAYYRSDSGISQFNKQLDISSAIVKEVLTKETIISEGEKILKVKKPDFLGYSMWSFKYQGRSVDAKILDQDWLNDFQAKIFTIQPGDSIRAMVKEEVSYGYNNEVIHTHYEVLKVIEIMPSKVPIQRNFL